MQDAAETIKPLACEHMVATIRRIMPSLGADATKAWVNAHQLVFVPRGTVLESPEAVTTTFYYLYQGLLRLFYPLENGEELTLFFYTEGLYGTCLQSFLSEKPGPQAIDALEDSWVLTINKTSLNHLYDTYPELDRMGRVYNEIRMMNAQKLLADRLLLKPEQRYAQLMEEQPQLLQRAPLKYLASFLGITPVSLSRIRARKT